MDKNCSKPSKGHKDGQSMLSVLKKRSLKLGFFRTTKKAKGDLIFVSHCLVGHYRDNGFRLLPGGKMRGQKATVQVSKREVKFDTRKSYPVLVMHPWDRPRQWEFFMFISLIRPCAACWICGTGPAGSNAQTERPLGVPPTQIKKEELRILTKSEVRLRLFVAYLKTQVLKCPAGAAQLIGTGKLLGKVLKLRMKYN